MYVGLDPLSGTDPNRTEESPREPDTSVPMNSKLLALLCVTLLMMPIGCVNIGSERHWQPYQIDAAEQDAKASLARGDHRLLAVNGFVRETPGVDIGMNEARVRYGVRVLDRTSDLSRSDEEDAFNISARKYAERYNREIVAQLNAR